MKKENVAYLIGGIAFGIVCGLLGSYMLFYQKEVVTLPQQGSPQTAMDDMQQPPEHMDIMQEIEALRGMLQKDPSNYNALVRLGNLYFDAVKFPQAIDYYSRAVALDDSDPNILTDLGICYRNTGDPKKAIEIFEKAHSKNPSHWQSIYNILIVSLNDLGDIPAAEKAYQKLEEIKPDTEGLEMMRKQIEKLKEQGAKKGAAS